MNNIDNTSYIGSINGLSCRTKKIALKEIGKIFNFPDYYGENLDALYDCLTDLSWLEYNKVVLAINYKDDFLKEESIETKNDFIDLLNDVREEWSKANDDYTKEFILIYSSPSPRSQN